MDANKHIRQAENNEELAEFLAGTPHTDWRCTVLFYAALHYVQAYFSSQVPPRRFGGHADRDTAIELDRKINAIYGNYTALKDSSRLARYEGWKPSEEQIKHEIESDLRAIKAHLRRFMPKIKL